LWTSWSSLLGMAGSQKIMGKTLLLSTDHFNCFKICPTFILSWL